VKTAFGKPALFSYQETDFGRGVARAVYLLVSQSETMSAGRGVWRESTRESRTLRCMEAANDYIKQSVGGLSKHRRSLKGIRRVEVFEKSI
jgi:hypothetical protein